jgi:hypothetical protein
MRFTGTELGFIVWGSALGALVGLGVQNGMLAGLSSEFFPPFVIVLLGLAVTEIIVSLATNRAPGTFIAMTARLFAFVGGVVGLYLVLGRLA